LISWKIPAALFFIKPRLDRKKGGNKTERKESLGEKERKKQGETQNCVKKSVF
jgi:hypothetical protein